MEIYRIVRRMYAGYLIGSGFEGRWNSEGFYIIYCAESRSLACLENLVHRNGQGLNAEFSLILIRVPKATSIKNIQAENLHEGWDLNTIGSHVYCQKIGDKWVNSTDSCVLKVPSAVIKDEHNYLINTRHSKFSGIKIVGIEPFSFDRRLKN